MLAKKIATVGMTAALTLVGAASAQAWSWASTTSANPPIYMTGGGGYGNLNFGAADITLQSWLRDTVVGDGRVYAHVTVNKKSDGSVFSYLNSGKRTDGESQYLPMANQTGYLDNGSGTFKYTVQTCRSVTLNDPCSTDKRRYGW